MWQTWQSCRLLSLLRFVVAGAVDPGRALAAERKRGLCQRPNERLAGQANPGHLTLSGFTASLSDRRLEGKWRQPRRVTTGSSPVAEKRSRVLSILGGPSRRGELTASTVTVPVWCNIDRNGNVRLISPHQAKAGGSWPSLPPTNSSLRGPGLARVVWLIRLRSCVSVHRPIQLFSRSVAYWSCAKVRLLIKIIQSYNDIE